MSLISKMIFFFMILAKLVWSRGLNVGRISFNCLYAPGKYNLDSMSVVNDLLL